MRKIRTVIVSLLILIQFFCCPVGFPSSFAEEDAPRARALLVACDSFITAMEITPAGKHNLDMMEAILAQDTRGFTVSRQYGITSSVEMLEYAINAAFGDAKEGDISLLYISTHGVFDASFNNPEGYLLLSDGSLEDRVSAAELNACLSKIKGIKVLLVDACNSGALIGKGVSPDIGSARVARMFQSGDYKVLTSSGASESSWYWTSPLGSIPPGSSYFTAALAMGAGFLGTFDADANRDGTITMAEMYSYLWVNQASSTVQMVPQDDDFPLIVYDRALLSQQNSEGELAGFSFQSTKLDAKQPIFTFGYTVQRATRAIYHITVLKDGVWDWRNTAVLPELSEFDGDMDPLGDVSPGRKQVTLDLSDILPEDWTYAMIHVITLGTRQEPHEPFVYVSRLLSAKRVEGDPGLSVRAERGWTRRYERELEIFIAHRMACDLSVSIRDEMGNVVRRLWVSKPTRSQALTPPGSMLYWNGRNTAGEQVKAGTYSVVASTRVSGVLYEAETTVLVEE